MRFLNTLVGHARLLRRVLYVPRNPCPPCPTCSTICYPSRVSNRPRISIEFFRTLCLRVHLRRACACVCNLYPAIPRWPIFYSSVHHRFALCAANAVDVWRGSFRPSLALYLIRDSPSRRAATLANTHVVAPLTDLHDFSETINLRADREVGESRSDLWNAGQPRNLSITQFHYLETYIGKYIKERGFGKSRIFRRKVKKLAKLSLVYEFPQSRIYVN